MTVNLQDWLGFILRWAHLIAGISWIGSSFYFMWLDSSLTPPESPRTGVEGELWMVHSGGFYQVEKRKIAPGQMPKTLHWFKWEAFFTWLTGIMLLSIVYYMTGGVYLLDANISHITPAAASALGVGLLIVSWFAYDLLWNSSLGKKLPAVGTALCYAGVVATTYGLCHILSGRAAYIHVGAMFGTIMVLNVWVRILPGQQKMINATQEGRSPDFNLGLMAKRRSVHNSYMTFPVLFIMLSNHYPMTYAHPYNWVVLLILIVLGASTRHAMIAKSASARKWAWLPSGAALLALILMTGPSHATWKENRTQVQSASTPTARVDTGPPVQFKQAQAVIALRCVACHSLKPTDDIFRAPPNGIVFDTPERIQGLVERIKFRAVVSKTMPLANKTGMTEDERILLGRWIDQGARTQ